jgi:hypothetical protein
VHFLFFYYTVYIFLDVLAVRIDVVVSLLASKLFFFQLATPPMLINASAPAIEFDGWLVNLTPLAFGFGEHVA